MSSDDRKPGLPGPNKRNRKASAKFDEIRYEFVSELKDYAVAESLDANEAILQKWFADSSDINIRRFRLEHGPAALAVFVDGLVNTGLVNEMLKALMILEGGVHEVGRLEEEILPVSQVKESARWDKIMLGILSGDTAILVDGEAKAVLLGIRGAKTRSISEPETETVVRGPREGFSENLRDNTSMLRRKLKTGHLKMASMTLGRQTNTSIVLSYLDHLADPAIVEEVKRRIERIDIDAILESGYIEEMIQDQVYSPFPQVQYTERPDTVASSLLEGRVAILVDGTPFVLIVPVTFWMMTQASEDYYERFPMGSLIRWLRYAFLVISLVTPALYVAITTYHQAMLPTTLLLSIAAARESIPFPAVVEALIMEITFEALREAGIRLPKAIGQTVSILGALVVGQAAVEAGIVSAPMVIVVSITGIASFTIPRYSGAIAIRMLRFPLTIAASIYGLFGVLLMIMIILGHMVSLRSFGVPYMSPVAPLTAGGIKDIFSRVPWYLMKRRPSFLNPQERMRVGDEYTAYIKKYGGQKGVESSEDSQEATGKGGSGKDET